MTTEIFIILFGGRLEGDFKSHLYILEGLIIADVFIMRGKKACSVWYVASETNQ